MLNPIVIFLEFLQLPVKDILSSSPKCKTLFSFHKNVVLNILIFLSILGCKFSCIILKGVALNCRKAMVSKEAFLSRALQKGCVDGSLKEPFSNGNLTSLQS